MSTRRRWGLALAGLLGLAAIGGCEEPEVAILEVDATGVIAGRVLLDVNGDSVASGQVDAPVTGLPLRLEKLNGALVAQTTTDAEGGYLFEGVPSGRLRLEADPDVLGDTLSAYGAGFSRPINVFDEVQLDLVGGLIYPIVGIAEARSRPPGEPLFTSGLALNDLNNDVDVLHIAANGGFLRITDLLNRGVRVGDTVRVQGTTAREAGQPYLRFGRVFGLGTSIQDIDPIGVTTAEAAAALGGTADAAYVDVDEALVIEAEDLDEEGLRVVVDDGSGPLEVLFREFLNVSIDDAGGAQTVRFTRLRGLLVPREANGATEWSLLPRNGSDFRIEVEEPPTPAGGALPD